MKYIEEAIKKAIDGGWEHESRDVKEFRAFLGDPNSFELSVWPKSGFQGYWIKRKISDICLDPLFWQSLGKSLDRPAKEGYAKNGWQSGPTEMAIMFMKHIMDGKSPDSFFQTILQ